MEKKHTQTESGVKAVVDQWVNNILAEELNEEVVRKEIKKMELKLKRYNILGVGYMQKEKEEDKGRLLFN